MQNLKNNDENKSKAEKHIIRKRKPTCHCHEVQFNLVQCILKRKSVRLIQEYFRSKIGRKIRIFSLGWKNSTKRKDYIKKYFKKIKKKKTLTNNFPENVKCTETANVPHFITVPKFSSFSNRNYRIYSINRPYEV